MNVQSNPVESMEWESKAHTSEDMDWEEIKYLTVWQLRRLDNMRDSLIRLRRANSWSSSKDC